MSRITLINEERVRLVTGFGYTEREASFLCLAALHGGFFLRRQFCQFARTSSGAADGALVEKLLKKGHGTAIAGCRKALVYHISARPFYAALGQENNRNRRMRPPVSIKNRLMGLDYILEHLGHRYFATEQEKVDYFTGTLGLDLADLPEKPFHSPEAQETTIRFFPDKYPLFLRQASNTDPIVCFTFIDEGTATLSRFKAHLHQYRRLFSRLAQFEVTYVAASPVLFWEAERAFRGFNSGQPKGIPASLRDLDPAKLLSYFEDKALIEAGRFDGFDKARLVRLRENRETFSGTFFDSLFRSWQAGGAHAVRAFLDQQAPCTGPLPGSLSTCLLRHNYDLFGTASNTNGI